MLAKLYRLRDAGEFEVVFKNGRKVVCPHLVFYGLKKLNPNTTPRLGLVVSKKVGGAVVRNRVKRVIRESFRLKIKSTSAVKVLEGTDFVIVARPTAAKLAGSELRDAIEVCLARLEKALQNAK